MRRTEVEERRRAHGLPLVEDHEVQRVRALRPAGREPPLEGLVGVVVRPVEQVRVDGSVDAPVQGRRVGRRQRLEAHVLALEDDGADDHAALTTGDRRVVHPRIRQSPTTSVTASQAFFAPPFAFLSRRSPMSVHSPWAFS